MRRFIARLLFTLAFAPVAQADNPMITRPSPHPVGVTLDRLAAAVREKSIAVVACVDHAAAAQTAGLSLRPTQLLIFGNPKLGTPLMQCNPRIGLDLPLRVRAWVDAAGKVWLGYTAPADLAARHRIGDRAEVVNTMAGVLDQLTTQATKP